jgi:sulfur-carrier protein
MKVALLYFASVREAVGKGGEELELPPGVHTPGALAAFLVTRSEGHARAFSDVSKLRCAVDQVMTDFADSFGEAREIAFFPPVTGG